MSSPLPNLDPYRYGPGHVIDGRYRLEEPLGEGGMGTVWRARHTVLNTPVAIKLVRPELRYTDVAQRLMLEAQVEAQLKHPNIVRVSDFGQTEVGDSFMVMELLSGRSLAKELELDGAMEPEQAVRLILPLLDALAYAHACGIVHRDIKPENIFLSRSESGSVLPKIVDFGIAAQERGAVPVESRITCRGTLLGSPPYMPPEQALGGEVDHRADIWSIAVVLHETITGKPLFDGMTCQAVLRQVLDDEIKDLGDGEAAASLWPILQPALVKDVDARAQSARELGCALAQWLIARGVTTDSCGVDLALAWSPEARAPRPVQIEIEAPLRTQLAAVQLADTARQRPSSMPTLRRFKQHKTAWAGAVATVMASLGLVAASSFDRGPEMPVAEAQAVEETPEPRRALHVRRADVESIAREQARAAQAAQPAPEQQTHASRETEPAPRRIRAARLKQLGLKDPY